MNYQLWVDFYSEFASALLHYKNNRPDLIEKMQAVFADTALKFPSLEKDGSVIDLDPFTVFGMFNRNITNENRTAILTGIADQFGITKAVSRVFDGVPVLLAMKTCFVEAKEVRQTNDINNLWDMFEIALRHADNPAEDSKTKFIENYDKVIKQSGVKWNLTMGLFWIRAYSYVSLDTMNKAFILDAAHMPAEFINTFPNLKKATAPPDGAQYLAICELGQRALASGNYEYRNFPELSDYAWNASQKVNASQDAVVKTDAVAEKVVPASAARQESDDAHPAYTKLDFLNEVYLNEGQYTNLVNVLQNQKNLILQGAPGVGKTYAAQRLAYSIMGVKDIDRVMMIQFHQSYSYEDFIMGFRPSVAGFELKKGPFYSFCKKAEADIDNVYFFIIDEINRGNLSKIFGELFMLIENDKRGMELPLLYSDEKFSVPQNLYVIGMMNTADRSLAMLDYALRRWFAFFELTPAFQSEGFRKYQEGLNSTKFNQLIDQIEQLNTAIENDESLGQGFRIGHSYFCNLTEAADAQLQSIINFRIMPLLQEYWFDEPAKVKNWTQKLEGAIM